MFPSKILRPSSDQLFTQKKKTNKRFRNNKPLLKRNKTSFFELFRWILLVQSGYKTLFKIYIISTLVYKNTERLLQTTVISSLCNKPIIFNSLKSTIKCYCIPQRKARKHGKDKLVILYEIIFQTETIKRLSYKWEPSVSAARKWSGCLLMVD